MSNGHENPAEVARKKARRALRTARLSLEDGDADAAVNRAYYAGFYMASAALALVGESPRTHKGTHSRFWQRFVDTGMFPAHLGSLLPHAQSEREKADYEASHVFDIAAAEDLVEDMESFVTEAEVLLRRLQEGGAE